MPVSHFFVHGEKVSPIFQPNTPLFTGKLGKIPPIFSPTQEPRILSPCLQYLQTDHYDDWITGVEIRYPEAELLKPNRNNAKRYKMDNRDVVISRLEWLFFVNGPSKHNLRTQ